MKVHVKICGIQTIQSAQAAVDAGADFLGFNFVPSSKRYINPTRAKEIIVAIKGEVKIVGIFQDADPEYVNSLAMNLPLNFVQLHGNENELFMKKMRKPVIKAIRKIYEAPVKHVPAFLLFDRAVQGKGEMVSAAEAQKVARQTPLFLAGGLNENNVQELIKKIKPYAVDVASGIETNGIADSKKIINFVQKTKEVFI